MTTGIPEVLKNANIPIYPSIQAGWHSRLKSYHFDYTEELMREFSEIIGLDPWLFTCLDDVLDHVDIHEEKDYSI